MKTLIWKELRENFKWALLALVVLVLAQFYALSLSRSGNDAYNNLTLCSSTFLLVTSFGYALVGAALGTLQILPERRRDQWAALLHRPVPRGSILLGKAAAGLALYFFATVPPFLASVAFVLVPGQFASPLVPGMLLPGLSDIFLGLAFYFLAMLLCLHRGRWWGSRGAIALAAVPIFVTHLSGGWPFLRPVAISALLGVAAWGAMQSNGGMRGRPLLPRLAGVAVIFAGCYSALLLLGSLGQLFIGQKLTVSLNFTNFQITRDGQVFLTTQKADGSGYHLTYPDGKPVTDERYIGNNDGNDFVQLLPLSWGYGIDLEEQYLSARPRFSYAYARSIDRNYDATENWYFLPQENYFVGYDRLSRRRIGFCDQKGFRPADATPEPFRNRLQPAAWNYRAPYFYWAGAEIYAIDFSERSIKTIYDAAGDVVHGVLNVAPTYEERGVTAIALDTGIKVLDREGKPLVEFPYGHDLKKWAQISIATNTATDRFFVQYTPGFWQIAGEPRSPTLLDIVNLQGQTLATYSLPPFSAPPPAPWLTGFFQQTTPPVFALAGTTWRKLFPPKMSLADFQTGPQPAFATTGAGLLGLLTLGLGLAALTACWAARAGLSAPEIRRWALFVFLFGVPGLLTFRLASDWPARVRCPQCRRKRTVETSACRACAADWPAPKPNGTEVFDLA